MGAPRPPPPPQKKRLGEVMTTYLQAVGGIHEWRGTPNRFILLVVTTAFLLREH